MAVLEFRKSKCELEVFFESVFAEIDCELFETHSNQNLKSFTIAKDLIVCIRQSIGFEGLQFSLWTSDLSSRPAPRTYGQKPGESHQVIEGCGIFNIQLEPVNPEGFVSGRICYFSETGARQKYVGPNGPETVNWKRHQQVVKTLQKITTNKKLYNRSITKKLTNCDV
jgi:hypothetical protein